MNTEELRDWDPWCMTMRELTLADSGFGLAIALSRMAGFGILADLKSAKKCQTFIGDLFSILASDRDLRIKFILHGGDIDDGTWRVAPDGHLVVHKNRRETVRIREEDE